MLTCEPGKANPVSSSTWGRGQKASSYNNPQPQWTPCVLRNKGGIKLVSSSTAVTMRQHAYTLLVEVRVSIKAVLSDNVIREKHSRGSWGSLTGALSIRSSSHWVSRGTHHQGFSPDLLQETFHKRMASDRSIAKTLLTGRKLLRTLLWHKTAFQLHHRSDLLSSHWHWNLIHLQTVTDPALITWMVESVQTVQPVPFRSQGWRCWPKMGSTPIPHQNTSKC